MIKQLEPPEFCIAAEVIRTSFSTVAKEFKLTQQNCPTHTGSLLHLKHGYPLDLLSSNGVVLSRKAVSIPPSAALSDNKIPARLPHVLSEASYQLRCNRREIASSI